MHCPGAHNLEEQVEARAKEHASGSREVASHD